MMAYEVMVMQLSAIARVIAMITLISLMTMFLTNLASTKGVTGMRNEGSPLSGRRPDWRIG
jgi:hypothetical protein